ncbi:MAG: hypothetical protein A2X48_13640 [Lentisphaerae bacterium GWF2_49_21]|nr:MAG: hypothetical protein A2X48_13640 [Lentisphaerae bacterium GWF2_49_21]
MSSIYFVCKDCGVRIEADEDFSGGSVICPKCSSELEVPLKGLIKGLDIGGYILEERIGAGGMGEVWLARQISLERHVALKILSPKLCKDGDFINRFTKEAKNSAKLVHPNIVTAYDGGFDKGFHYLAVQYIQGIELGIRLKLEGVLSEKEALHVVRGIAEGLCYAWNKYRILHRDIKPANMIVDKGGIPKLMDLGISKSLTEDISLTLTGFIVGTPSYMSPEQAKGEKGIDCRADIYSLGVTLYQLVTGRLPYEGENTMAILSSQISDPFPPPRKKNPEISEQCSVLLEIMMAKSPDKRQKDWEEVIRDIDLLLEGKMPQSRKRNQSVVAALGNVFSRISEAGSIVIKGTDSPDMKKRQMKIIYTVGLTTLLIIVLFISAALMKKAGNCRNDRAAKIADKEEIEKKQNKIEPEKKIEKAAAVPVKVDPAPGKPKISTPDQLKEELARKNPKVSFDKGFIRIEDGKWTINLESPAITDISPLADLPIKGLSLNGTNVTDINPLKGLPITYINLSGLRISDFGPLKGMPLDSACFVNSQIKDLSVIDNKNMHCLMIINAPVEDISPLAGMKLTKLWLVNTKVSDLRPLKGMDLHELAIDNTQVKDLSPLKGMPLEILAFTPGNFGPKDMSLLHDEMKSLKYIGSSLSDVSQNKQTAEEFWKKFQERNMKNNDTQRPPPPRR